MTFFFLCLQRTSQITASLIWKVLTRTRLKRFVSCEDMKDEEIFRLLDETTNAISKLLQPVG